MRGPAAPPRPVVDLRWDVATPELLDTLLADPLPLRLASASLEHSFHRDTFLDTEDGSLRDRDIVCRFRITSSDRRLLTLSLREPSERGKAVAQWQCFEAQVPELEPLEAVRGTSEPARRLRALIDPARLAIDLVVSTERHLRRSSTGWLRRAEFEFIGDVASLEGDGLRRSFCELKVRRISGGRPTLTALASAIQQRYAVRPTIATKIDRARRLSASLRRESERRGLDTAGAVVLIVIDRGRVACRSANGEVELPRSNGSGEGAVRHLLAESFRSRVGELRLLGIIPAAATRPRLEVWLGLRPRLDQDRDRDDLIEWLPIDELTALVGTPSLRDAQTIAALLLAARSEVFTRAAVDDVALANEKSRPSPIRIEGQPTSELLPNGQARAGRLRLLDPDESALAFNARVLAMAEDTRTPLLERLRYNAIVSGNLDEFFMVRVAALKRIALAATGERTAREHSAEEQLAELRPRIDQLIARQERCALECLEALRDHAMRLTEFESLDTDSQQRLRDYFRKAIQPALTPHAITQAPGYPSPTVTSGALSLLVVIKDPQTGPLHLASLRIPPTLPRFVALGSSDWLVPIEQIIRDQIDTLYPGRAVLQAYVFRATRAGELNLREAEAGNLLQAIEEDTHRRRTNPIVRVEIERAMPATLRTLLLEELRLDVSGEPLFLGANDVYESSVLVDLGALRELASQPKPNLAFPEFEPKQPFAADVSLFALVRTQDQLVHHPYDDFNATVLRFLKEAADDPDVITIKATLYRAGEQSPIVETLIRAAESGKEVVAFVELKARFDEERNVQWARQLRDAGLHVIYGLVGLKNHAKMLLVTRRESGAVRRYVHIGTGNYHAGTARVYTDLGLFTTDEEVTADVSDLFNELTGSAQGPRGSYRRLLVAPHLLLRGLLDRIARESMHARDGLGGRIRLKVNGLTDVELIEALYAASQAGVRIDLIVRGICRLNPGVPGLSENIRVVSILGRFLEHARIYHFGNGGDDEYFIGSADWRGRNLRRRIEVVTPVVDPACRERLDGILERELNDTAAWQLMRGGRYERAPFAAVDDLIQTNSLSAR